MPQPGLYLVTPDGEEVPLHTASAEPNNIEELHEYLDSWDITPIQEVQEETHEWRMEEWPDLTALAQAFGTSIEMMELGELILKAEYYDDDWANEARLKEEAGDAMIYLLGVMSLLDLDVTECLSAARDKNSDRDWDEHQEAPDASVH